MRHACHLLAILAVAAAFSISSVSLAADNKAGNPEPDRVSSQAQVETLDLTVYQKIRDEGLLHSHIMEYASALFDGVARSKVFLVRRAT